MCAIAGFVGCADMQPIEPMTRVMAHRGPDDWGVKSFEPHAALGHRRLSILDLSERGHQPMTDCDRRFWITFNGEIYNFIEVRRRLEAKGHTFVSDTDTEVLLNAFKQWGPECVEMMNGMFAFAIWDSASHTLFAARDRMGIKPFYYYHAGDLFVFASEIKALLESGLVPREVDYLALHTPKLYQASPSTGFKHIHKLPPAHHLVFRHGELSLRRYWSIEPRETQPSTGNAIQELDELIVSAVKMQMIADVPVGAFLSGGLDSSLIVALMQKESRQPVETFTIRYSDRDQKFEQMPDDSRYAQVVATQFGCRHHEFTIEPQVTELLPKMTWHLDEPLSDPATINTYLISKAARERGIIVMLNGMGGDEIFGGYRQQLAAVLAGHYRAYVPELGRRMIANLVDRLPSATGSRGIRGTRWAKRFLSLANQSSDRGYALGGMIDPERYRNLFSWNHVSPLEVWDHPHIQSVTARLTRDRVSALTRMCLADTEVFLPDHNLTYSDKCTMAAGVEGRPPLTDHRIVEYMFSLHPQFRIRRLTQKYLLKRVGEKYLSRTIVHRPKAPFGAPLRSWIRRDLAPMVGDLLSEQSLQKRGIYNPRFIAQAIENDRRGKEDNAHLIWQLLCNELWFRTFFA
jgi:asparagine synthase (glutamine-hydrolysing)